MPPTSKYRPTVWIAVFGFLLLVALHLDFWRPQRLVFHLGWLPEELAYRIVYLLLAWLYMLWICGLVWREEGE